MKDSSRSSQFGSHISQTQVSSWIKWLSRKMMQKDQSACRTYEAVGHESVLQILFHFSRKKNLRIWNFHQRSGARVKVAEAGNCIFMFFYVSNYPFLTTASLIFEKIDCFWHLFFCCFSILKTKTADFWEEIIISETGLPISSIRKF